MNAATNEANQAAGERGTDAADAALVVPFWQRMPRLFLFPLQRAPLQRNLLASAVSCALACVFFSGLAEAPARSLGLLLLVFCAGSLYIAQFSFLVIERTASGYLDSRTYPRSAEAGDWGRPIKMFLVLVLVPIAIGVLGFFLPPFLGKIALLAWAMLLPASVMVMTMTDSFGEAVNPVRCLNTALGIGAPYLLLCLYLILLNLGFHEVMQVVLRGASLAVHVVPAVKGDHGAVPPPQVSVSMTGFVLLFFSILAVSNYFFILTCVLIGYAMYQYSAVLGVAIVGPGEARVPASTSAAAHARRQREVLIGQMVAAGEIREALELINNELRERPTDLSLHVRLHTLLLHEGSRPKIETHAERYLELLLATSNTKDALALWEQTRVMFPPFMPRDPAQWPRLADEALAVGKAAEAADLVRGFDRKFPGHPQIPDVYVIGARILLQGSQPDQAKRLLTHVVSLYPDTPAAAEAKRYLVRFS